MTKFIIAIAILCIFAGLAINTASALAVTRIDLVRFKAKAERKNTRACNFYNTVTDRGRLMRCIWKRVVDCQRLPGKPAEATCLGQFMAYSPGRRKYKSCSGAIFGKQSPSGYIHVYPVWYYCEWI